MKYAIPPQNIELDDLSAAKSYSRSGGITYGVERNEMCRPPKSFEYRGKEYYFNALIRQMLILSWTIDEGTISVVRGVYSLIQ